MDIAFAAGGMPFGPTTLTYGSLGGSETAVVMAAQALARLGHSVTVFSRFPAASRPDAWQPGIKDDHGVRWFPIEAAPDMLQGSEIDLFVAVRDPQIAAIPAAARKKVLWAHDIFTKRGMARAIEAVGWTWDEVWAVSEWHKKQINEATNYPLERIVALRNGIVPVLDIIETPRASKTFLYAARPERGLDNLIRPGGIMDLLPDYTLKVAMYDHFPEDMKGYYQQIFARMKAMPNVEFIGPQPQSQLRQIMAEATAYIYPTQFEETSCIIAREAIEQRLPFLTTKVGALPETLGDCGIYFEDWLNEFGIEAPKAGSDGWNRLFAEFVRDTLERSNLTQRTTQRMAHRDDLYWDDVAVKMIENSKPYPVTDFSRAWSLIQDGDVIPALAFMRKRVDHGAASARLHDLLVQTEGLYPFLKHPDDKGYKSLGQYYDDLYRSKDGTDEGELRFSTEFRNPRLEFIAQEISQLPAGSRIVEYGCGAGHLIAALAKNFPQHQFIGIEIAQSAVDCVNNGAAAHNLTNLRAICGSTNDLDKSDLGIFDLAYCSEVLEHVPEPWSVLQWIESLVDEGDPVLFTVPFGPWEPMTFHKPGRWTERAHIWQIDKTMIQNMLYAKGEENVVIQGCMMGSDYEGRHYGNLMVRYPANHEPIYGVNPVAKAYRHRSRQTVGAAVIAYNNEDTIVRMLNSLDGQVQAVQIAHGPHTDDTKAVVEKWMKKHPWISYTGIDVPKIEAWKFGFDDARNVSAQGLATDFDWMLWIDTDEYLSGDIRKYLRGNHLDGYLLPQHHFTVSPRGAPLQIDRPARLVRTTSGFRALGHIHEHFEVPAGGPGQCIMLPDIDIGHTGYVNEDVRKDRFVRNFPFLEWDHASEGGQRKLHSFLWLRDIIHRMRYAVQHGNPAQAMSLANEAVAYYNEKQADMAVFGPGIAMSLQYMSEVYTMLNRGIPIKLAISLDDRSTELTGRFESYAQLENLLKQTVEPEFTERLSRYY